MVQKALSLVGTLGAPHLLTSGFDIKVDVELRLDMRKNIVISGSTYLSRKFVFNVYALLGPTTLFPGLKERLQDGISSVLNAEAKVIAAPGEDSKYPYALL